MRIKQTTPNFVHGFKPVVANFQSLDELHAIPFVAGWLSRGAVLSASPEEEPEGPSLLIADFPDQGEWWVVGRVDASAEEMRAIGLPATPTRVDERTRGLKVYSKEELSAFAASRGLRASR